MNGPEKDGSVFPPFTELFSPMEGKEKKKRKNRKVWANVMKSDLGPATKHQQSPNKSWQKKLFKAFFGG